MAKIIIYVPDEAPVKYGLDDETEVTVGRAEDNDIVLEHDSISGHHAKFANIDGQFHLIDLDSTNGTFADGVEAANTPLHNGMRVIFGTVEADYECTEFEGEAAAEGEDAPAPAEAYSGSESGATGIHADASETSVRPAGFKDLSPVEKVEKKDSLAQIALVLGVVAIIAALALVGVSFTM